MTGANEKQLAATPATETPGRIIGDMAPLIARVREFTRARAGALAAHTAIGFDQLQSRFGYTREKKKRAEVIVGAELGAELGHPSTESMCFILVTQNPALVEDGQIGVIGPDVNEMNASERRPFAQVIMLAAGAGAQLDPFALDSAQYLMQRLDGYMTRSVPGRLWARLGRRAISGGLGLSVAGSALIDFYKNEFKEVLKAEVLFVTSSTGDVAALRTVGTEAAILAGRHKKLALGLDGEVECNELNCETCDEKPVCDSLRDIVVKRRRIKNER